MDIQKDDDFYGPRDYIGKITPENAKVPIQEGNFFKLAVLGVDRRSLLLGGYDAFADGDFDEGGHIVYLELFHDMVPVAFYG